MASFPARDIAARYGANPKKGKRKLGDTPIPKYPSIHSNRSERTREAVVSHFTANPAAASSVLGLRNNSAYSAQHKKNMQLKFLETSCPLHLPGGAPYLPVVKRAPPPLLRAGQTSAPAQPSSSSSSGGGGGDAAPATGSQRDNSAADDRFNQLMNEAFANSTDDDGTKPCPNCRIPIEHLGGCHHHTCTMCNAKLCWKCGRFSQDSYTCSYSCSKAGRRWWA